MASEATGVSGLAGRYASALFDLADEQKALDQVATDLTQLRTMIEESSDLTRLLRSPVLSRESQAKALDHVVSAAGLSTLTRNFVGLVARNRRLFELKAMIDGFRQLLAERRGEIKATVTTAQRLTDEQITALTDELRRAVGAKVVVDIWIDPAIIGGLIVKVGSRMVDSSLRSKLQRLQLAMRGI